MFPRFSVHKVLFFALFCALPASAQEATSPTESSIALDELIARALQFNPQPQIAAANTEAARARADSARATLGPTLQVVPGFGGNQQSRDEEIILSQPVDLFGVRRANRAVFDAQLRGAVAARDGATRTVIIAVKNAAAQLFAAQEAESLGQAQLEIATQFRDAAARRAQLGEVPTVQRQRAQLELDRAALELDAARAQRAIRRVRLNQLIGAAPETPLRVSLPQLQSQSPSALRETPDALPQSPNLLSPSPNSLPQSPNLLSASPNSLSASPNSLSASPNALPQSPDSLSPSPGSLSPSPDSLPQSPNSLSQSPDSLPTVPASSQVGSDLIAARAALLPGALQRPDVLSAQAAADVARAQANAIAATRRPQLEIQARRGGVFRGAQTSLRAVLTVPLFDLGAIKNQQRAAQFQAQAEEKQVELLLLQVAAQLESALISLNQSRALAARYRDSLVPQTLDLLRKTQLGYAAGASTYLEVLEAQRATRQVQTEYLQALVGVRAGEADLEAALGTDYVAPTGAIDNPDNLTAPPDVAAPGTVPDGVVLPN